MDYRNRFRLRHDLLWGSRRGAVAILFALTLVPLLIGAGIATDFSRIQILKASLQTIADSAALAGASELNQNSVETTSAASAKSIATDYFNKGYAALTDSGSTLVLTVKVPNSNTVTVRAKVALNMTLMSLFTAATQSLSVFAKAEGPGYALKMSTSITYGGADANTIFYYVVPAGGGHPPVIPSTSNPPMYPGYTPLFSSDPAYAAAYGIDNSTASISVGPGDKIGFALFNVTGANGSADYIKYNPTNSYNRPNGSLQDFFSNIAAPSMDPLGYPIQPAYTTQSASPACVKTPIKTTTNTSLTRVLDPCGIGYPCVTSVDGVAYQNNLMVNNQCSTPASATQTCLQLYQNPTTFSWGDMGGTSNKNPPQDDFNYVNISYTVQCIPNLTGTGSNAQPNAVILVQ